MVCIVCFAVASPVAVRTPNGPMPPVLKSRELFSGRSEKRWYLRQKS